MEVQHFGQVEVGEDVTVNNKEGIVYVLLSILDSSGSAQRLCFDAVDELCAELTGIAEVVCNAVRFITHGQNGFFYVVTVEVTEDIFDEGFIQDWHHGFYCGVGEGA